MTAPILWHAADESSDCDFNQVAPHPADPIEWRMSTQRTQPPERVDNAHNQAVTLD
jgi:hypothetical protein